MTKTHEPVLDHSLVQNILQQVGRRVVGQEAMVERLMISLLTGGHVLLVGVPGLAKTLLIASLARVLDLRFNRIQFTPDLMPSDITGTDLVQEDTATGRRQMVFAPGPIFANIVLADEINRTPPKTQAALLEAMQERRITIDGQEYNLDSLSAEAKSQLQMIQLTDAEITRLNAQLAIAQTARRAYAVALQQALGSGVLKS